ncbi:MAG TPA: phosphopantothenoylcysteine decarboxylase [Candidatus Limnocylindria bacterium]|nr:phosphopantothenoylcysteine decarboxylase [Candidatus Limnocylindria bacterium]
MRLLLTFGPAWEPLDGARRLTNMSTGRLGVQLANAFVAAGWEVHCLRGEGATYQGPLHTHEVETFATNDDLADKLWRISRLRQVDAVFHAAALCDYRIARVTNSAGKDLRSAKIATREGRLWLELEPATKVLPQLRGWFPQARIVGWKYELVGTRDDAFAKARRQLGECGTNACVLNGAAYGDGFGLYHTDGTVKRCDGSTQLADSLLAWLGARPFSAPQAPLRPRRLLRPAGLGLNQARCQAPIGARQ